MEKTTHSAWKSAVCLLLVDFVLYSCGAAAAPAPAPLITAGNLGILSQGSWCRPPCFRGIRPGVTTIEDAAAIFGELCQIKDNRSLFEERLISKQLECGAKISITALAYGQDEKGLKVSSIGLHPSDLTLGQLLERYGAPDQLHTSVSISGEFEGMTLYFHRIQATATLPGGPACCEYPVTAGTPVEAVGYYAADVYQRSLRSVGYRPWEGYKSYKAAINLQ